MAAIGITGGIATGKTVFARQLVDELPGATMFNADVAARELTDRDPEVQLLIGQVFGPAIYSAPGHLNRALLRTIVFADPEKKLALEQILHPRIRRQWALEAESRRDSTDLFFADIPLLYETGGETLCDRVIVVACTPRLQRERLMTRASLNADAAEEMISAQMPLNEKIARADHVVWNDGPLMVLADQARLLAGMLRQ
ncbi:MAG: dephospho-CoA kinase [Verrucomicrobiota bacterium]|nr:dephospho-CoA kinase [Verrucomicrobiota bacterium]